MKSKKMNQREVYRLYRWLWARRNFLNRDGATLIDSFAVYNDVGVLVKKGIPVYVKEDKQPNGTCLKVTAQHKVLAEVIVNHKHRAFAVRKLFSIFEWGAV